MKTLRYLKSRTNRARTYLFNLRHPRNWTKRTVLAASCLLILVLALGSGSYALFFASNSSLGNSVNLSNGLVGYWPLDGNANDQSGYGNNGTINGTVTPTTGPTGQADGAMNFDGSTGYIEMTNGSSYNFPNTTFSVSFWEKSSSSSTGQYSLWEGGDSSTYCYGWGLRGDGAFVIKGTASGNSCNQALYIPTSATSQAFSNGQWHNIVYVVTTNTSSGPAGSVKMYVDGALDGGYFNGAVPYQYRTSSIMTLGTRPNPFTGSWNWPGNMSDLRIYNRALNPSEITALYNLGDTVNLQRGLVGYWKLNGNTNDSTPNRDNGVITGNVTPTTGPTGQPNTAMSFNNGYIYLPDPDSLIKNTQNSGEVSYSVWFKPSLTTGSIFTQGTSYDCLYEPQLEVGWVKLSGCSQSGLVSNISPTEGWNMLTATFSKSANSADVYLNGSLVGSVTISSIMSNSDSPTRIFNDFTGGAYIGTQCSSNAPCSSFSDDFLGSISGLRIYNRAINPAEVKALYDSYQPSLNTNSLSKGLVGEWKLNGNAKDSTPYRNNGTITGTVTSAAGPNGQAGGAMSCDGSTGYISAPVNSASKLNMGTSNWTVGAWIKLSGTNKEQGVVGVWNAQSVPYWYLFVNSGGAHRLGIRLQQTSTQSASYSSAGTITDTAWHYVAVSIDRSGLATFYIDGVASGTADVSAFAGLNLTSSNSEFNICDIGEHYPNFLFQGSISDVRIYNRTLSASEVRQLYGSYGAQVNIGGDGSSSSINLTKGLVGYWPFNGNANDATPYRDNGTVTGATLADDRFGRANSAYSFDGSSSYISIPITSNSALNPPGGLSLSAWINPSKYQTGNIISNHNGTAGNSNYRYRIMTDGTVQELFGNVAEIQTTQTVPLDKWSLVTFTTNGTACQVYINVALSTQGSCTYRQVLSVGPVYVGTYAFTSSYPSGTEFFAGSIDDARIYNRALSAGEVQALYNLND